MYGRVAARRAMQEVHAVPVVRVGGVGRSGPCMRHARRGVHKEHIVAPLADMLKATGRRVVYVEVCAYTRVYTHAAVGSCELAPAAPWGACLQWCGGVVVMPFPVLCAALGVQFVSPYRRAGVSVQEGCGSVR